MEKLIFFCLLLLAYFHGGFSVKVMCVDQQEACICSESATECEFQLDIEELQTFTSYVIEDNDLLTRGTPGDTYYLNETGYHPAVPNDATLPEYGLCYLNFELLNERDFGSNNCSKPVTVDGVTYRRYIAVNGRIPGPTIIVTQDQLVKVTVVNRLTSEAITIHWHGMHQRDTPWMDGVGFVSHYPIGPGATFDYIFKATPPGTHWYHSHVGAQRTDGLFGALIVREKDNFFRDNASEKILADADQHIFDNQNLHTLTLLDWQREASLDLFVQIHSTLGFYPSKAIGKVPTNRDMLYRNRTRSDDGAEVGPVPYWSGLINGKGRFNNSIRTPLSLFNISRDSIYRFRVIGAQSLYAYKLSIDEHKLRVIATDGILVEPELVDYIVVHSGERYDFLVEALDDPGPAYWIRAETLETQTDSEHSALAILNYGSPEDEVLNWRQSYSQITSTRRQCTEASPCKVLNCPFKDFMNDPYTTCIHLTNLRPLYPLPENELPKFDITPDCPDCLQFFNFGFEGDSSTSAINGKNFELPVVPYQTNCGQYNRDLKDPNADTCSMCEPEDPANPVDCRCIHVAKIVGEEKFDPKKEPKTVMMVFSAVGNVSRRLNDFAHPIHLHGHSFHILHIGHGNYSDSGRLIGNSPDVTCGNDYLCKNPGWTDGMFPDAVKQAAAGVGGRIINTAIQKDTVIVPAGGYVVIAFKADNPGYWFLHCHIEVHQLEGMGVLIEEYDYTYHKSPPDPINRQGNFRWEIKDYNAFIKKNMKCGAIGINMQSVFIVVISVILSLMTVKETLY